ncbi:MAG: Trm112 family protein [Desulfurococcales archaeon]|nr:Trm112 family protein [Desulfurococcales archaeon]
MRYYFLELLACPECKTPRLIHYTLREEKGEVRHPVETLRCREWCGLYDKPASEVSIEECKKCVARDVVEGVLICRNCGRWYPIIDGIPRLIDDKYRREKEDLEFLERNLSKIPLEVRRLMKRPALKV